MRKSPALPFLITTLALLASDNALNADVSTPTHQSAPEFPVCLTETWYDKEALKDAAACPIIGDCDLPEFRDAAFPSPTQPFITIRVLVHILANDDGSNPATNVPTVDGQMMTLNQSFAQHRIQFQWHTKIDSATVHRDIALTAGNEANQMKSDLAVEPASQLNIYVTNTNPSGGTGVFAFFGNALTATGGIVADDNWFAEGWYLLVHEVGHVFGLHHTHRGVCEVSSCGPCYERADGIEGDLRGDFCSDTPPTPVNTTCSQPGGVDLCSGEDWGTILIQNYMSYSHPLCMTSFTPQQVGRMHCWIGARLTGWFACDGIVPPPGSDSLGDYDGDGWGLADDICPNIYNPCQEDADSNGVGDVCECMCDCPGDPACNGPATDVIDVTTTLTVAFRGAGGINDPNTNCNSVISDVDCSGATDVLDVVKVIGVAFRGGNPETEFCDPCAP